MTQRRKIAFLAAFLAATMASGCAGVAHIATAAADARQVPPRTSYGSTQSADRLFTAAAQSMARNGTLLSSDRSSGVVQGKKGNWGINAEIVTADPGSQITVSARYNPSTQMDFNSREGVTNAFLAELQSALGEELVPLDSAPTAR